jgi:hypothetical protein
MVTSGPATRAMMGWLSCPTSATVSSEKGSEAGTGGQANPRPQELDVPAGNPLGPVSVLRRQLRGDTHAETA